MLIKTIKNCLVAVFALVAILTVASCKKRDYLSKVDTYTLKSERQTAKMPFYDNGTFRVKSTSGDYSVTEGIYTRNLNKDEAVITFEGTEQTLKKGKKQGLTYSVSAEATVKDNGKKLDCDGAIWTHN